MPKKQTLLPRKATQNDRATKSYKTLALPSPEAKAQKANQFLRQFNECFDHNDIQLSQSESGYEIRVRELSKAHLDKAIASLKDKSPGNEDLLDSIKNAIENLGSYGLRGKKRLYVGYNEERKVANRKQKETHRGKHYYANDSQFESENQRLPAEYANKILCGDSESELKALPNNCVDLIFTSPPYNFGLGYDEQNDSRKWEAYFDKLFSIFDECIRVLKYGGRIVINVQPLFSDYIPSHHIISNHMMARRLIWKGEIIWEKNNYNCKYTAWGSWKSPSSPYLKYTWEFLEIFCKGSLKKIGGNANADITSTDFKKWVLGKWSIAPEHNMRSYGHPAVFPVELAKRVLLLFSFKGDTILDPFSGVGTTCLAAKNHGRVYLGIDNSPQYCAVARDRLAGILL